MKRHAIGLLKAFSSLKLTITLLFIIAMLCLIGTVFPQRGDIASSGHGLEFEIASLLSPHAIFQSIWFMTAGFALCVNLVLCMRRKLNRKRKNLLILVMHGSILLIIAGYILGATSVDGLMEIPEGASVSKAVLKDGSLKDLGFSVRCARFTVDYYSNGMPKEYVSDLAFVMDDHVVRRTQVKVNHPAHFAGMSFYQESFQSSISAVGLAVSDGKKKTTRQVAEGDIIPLSPGTQAQVAQIRDDLMRAGPAVKLIIEDPSGQQYLWVFKNLNSIKRQMPNLFKMAPHFDPSGFRPYTFALENMESSYVTGIGVKRDPGIPLVSVGGALFLVSLLLIYLFPRTRPALRSGSAGLEPVSDPSQEGPAGDFRDGDTLKGSPT